MKGLQVIEADVYLFENGRHKKKLIHELKLSKNEFIAHNGLLIVTREWIEKDE